MYRLLLLLFASCAFAQTGTYQVIFQKNYAELPFKTRITPSGIYGISSFTAQDNTVSLQTFDSKSIYEFSNNTYARSYNYEDTQNALLKKSASADKTEISRPCYIASQSVFRVSDGNLSNDAGESISVQVPSRNKLILSISLQSGKIEQSFAFDGNLAAADVIGIDAKGREYILIEKYMSDIPLEIKREVWAIASDGTVLSKLEIPQVKYLSTISDFSIDAEGNLYHLLSEQNRVSVFKWIDVGEVNGKALTYPDQYQYALHYNTLLPKKEAAPVPLHTPSAGASRTQALHTAESYVLYKYTCTAANLAPSPVVAADTDTVQTPPRLIVGCNAEVPYKWGGFNTLSGFASGLAKGRYAGDIDCSGSSSYAVGVDCSGFVSRCWQLSSHYVTSEMPSITTQYSTWDSLRPADAILRDGHVRMFVQKNSNGSLKVVESSGRDWGVSYWSYLPSDLTAYTPCYYNSMETNYSLNRPDLYSALLIANGSVQLRWQCDTTGVTGYRLYSSKDNATWTLLKDETTLKTTSITITGLSGAVYYRVSSVNGKAAIESDWSNVLGAAYFGSAQKVLILDGFYRELGDWRGAGHTFVYNYGKALETSKINFESVRSKQLNLVSLSKYKAIFRICGDQSTADSSITGIEQDTLKTYLEQGGCLFISGSEIGWDLYNKGTTAEKSFYNNYLKAAYLADDSGVSAAVGEAGSVCANLSFQFGQTYAVDYPDEINTYGGSSVMLRYSNNKVAGIQYTGTFGTSVVAGKVMYIAFPLETTANDTVFNTVINKSMSDFLGLSAIQNNNENSALTFSLSQNYPNPFNPSTSISFSLARTSQATLKVFDVLGKEIAVLVNEEKPAGKYKVSFNAANLPSGIYFYNLRAENFTETKKFILLK
jgi:cell wall-associated NlpC family hydrolase